jgi:hypothetical protein
MRRRVASLLGKLPARNRGTAAFNKLNGVRSAGQLCATRPIDMLASMRDFTDLEQRLEELAQRAAGPDADALLLVELENLLSEGYARALAGDARRRRLDERLDELIARLDEPGVAGEVRRVTMERRTVDRGREDLRARLELVRDELFRHVPRRESSA